MYRLRLFLAAGSAAAMVATVMPSAAQAVPAGEATGKTAVVHSAVTPSAVAQRAASYWTRERMLNAIPVPAAVLDEASAPKAAGPQGRAGKVDPVAPATARPTAAVDPGANAAPWPGPVSSPPGSTSGKVFFVGSDGGNYQCSGGTVNSAGKDVVFTAGHCVGRFGVWFNSAPWIFVPGYNHGNAPFGLWTAAQLWTLNAWFFNDDRAHDIGAAVMNTNGLGQHIVDVVGGQGIEWNWPLEQYQFQFGYPGGSPVLMYCTGNSFNDGGFNGINCNMVEGASGGSWLDDFDGTFGWLDGVNSWVFWNAAGVRFKWNSPYFGNNARDLYNTVANL